MQKIVDMDETLAQLLGGPPMSWRWLNDGDVRVITAEGRKVRVSAETMTTFVVHQPKKAAGGRSSRRKGTGVR